MIRRNRLGLSAIRAWPTLGRFTGGDINNGTRYNHSRLPENARAAEVILNIDIWLLILDLVVEECAGCFETCSSTYFPRFLREWDFSTIDRLQARHWRRLRMVCRLWARLLDPNWTPYRQTWDRAKIAKGKRIRTLHVYDDGSWSRKNKFKRDHAFVQATMHINTILIMEINNHSDKFFIDSLFHRCDMFTHLRSLRLDTLWASKLDFKFWSDLERCFPRLVALSISTLSLPIGVDISTGLRKSNGMAAITLPRLEIVHFSMARLPLCTFKSLKHCSLQLPSSKEVNNLAQLSNPSLVVNSFEAFSEFLQSHRKNLESLVLFGFPNSFILDKLKGGANSDNDCGEYENETIWSNFPNLCLLGTSSTVASKLCQPKPLSNHPFQHIFINKTTTASIHPHNVNYVVVSTTTQPPDHLTLKPSPPDPVKELSSALSNLNGVRYLTLDTQIIVKAQYKRDFASKIQTQCQKRGIKYIALPLRKKTMKELMEEQVLSAFGGESEQAGGLKRSLQSIFTRAWKNGWVYITIVIIAILWCYYIIHV